MKSLTIVLLFFTANIFAQDFKDLTYKELDSLYKDYSKKQDFNAAILYAEAGKTKALEQYGAQDSIYAKFTYRCARTYANLHQHAKSEQLYREAVGIFEKAIGKNYVLYADALSGLGALYWSTGRFEEAEDFFKKALVLREKLLGKKHEDYSSSLNDLASVYLQTSKHEEAEPLFLACMAIDKQALGDKHPYYAQSLSNLAAVYKEMGRLEQAESMLLEARTIIGETLGKEHPFYAQINSNLASMYPMMDKAEKAVPFAIEALEIFEKVFGKKHPDYAQCLANLANLYTKLKKYDLAEKMYQECWITKKLIWGDKHPEVLFAMGNIGALYYEIKKYNLAEPLFLATNAEALEILGKDHRFYIASFNNLANLYLDIKSFDKSWHYLTQALNIATGLTGNLNISTTWADSIYEKSNVSYNKTFNILVSLGLIDSWYSKNPTDNNHEKQILTADLALRMLKKSRDNFSNSKEKTRVLELSHKWTIRRLELADKEKDVSKSFEVAEQNKSILLLESTQTEKAYQMGGLPDSLIKKETDFQKRQDQIEANLIEVADENEKSKLRKELNDLNVSINQFKEKIEKEYPKYADFKYKQANVSVEDIQKNLKKNAALLEYVLSDSAVYVFYIDQQHAKIFTKYIEIKELNKRIQELHNVLSNYILLTKKEDESYQKYSEQAYWFYRNFVEPVLKDVKDINQLIIVTDGELGHLPFEAFLVESAPQKGNDYSLLHYLIQDYKISYNYSATLWKENKTSKKATNNGQVLAMAADYEVKLNSEQLDLRLPVYQRLRATLNPLPEAKKEIGLLSENFQGVFATDKTASEKSFKENAGAYSIIHLAMHGLLDNKAPILSSLAFTEDGDSLENNFLQAHEISKLKLNADLVILSACETGYGKFEKGNGIASLARAFMYAGASSLIVSLWQVNDFSTSKLMQNLYANLAAGMDKDEALQQAKLQYIKDAKGIATHPAFWSPFILIGNESPIKISKKSGSLPWLIGGGVLFFLALGGFMMKRAKK